MWKTACLIAFIISSFFYLSPLKVYADGGVVINEFLVEPDSNQWVEVYNKGNINRLVRK